MAISSTALTTAGQDIFVCPGTLPSDSREYAVTCIVFCNISVSDATLTVHAVVSGGTVNTTNQIINALLIPAGETFTFDTEKFVLSTGDRVHAIASANSRLVSTVSSMRVS